MTRPVSLNELARSELEEAAHFYGLESPALRVAFLDALDGGLDHIREFPESAPLVRGKVRRVLLRRFPYSVLYSLHPGEIRNLAVMHQSRRPSYWGWRA